MRGLLERKGTLAALFAGTGILALLLALRPAAKTDGSLLLSLLFLVAVAEGCIAAAAAGALVNGRWMPSVRKELLSVSHLLPAAAVLLLLLVPFLDAYPWAGRQTAWLRKDFFIGRNVVLLLLAYAAARRFAAAPAGSDAAKAGASWYILAFVASQTLTAFDLVMSLEYPWISTLLGGYFFVESVYGGFAVSTLLYLAIHGRPETEPGAEPRSDLSDLSTLMFGFSLMWAGLFFAQFLTIWYGNIPEEVSFLAKRLSSSPLRELSVAVVALLFFAPFLVLMATRAKSSPSTASAAAVCILAGILVERYVFLAPVVRVSAPASVLLFSCIFLLFAALVFRKADSR